MVRVYIDTTDRYKTIIELTQDGKKIKLEKQSKSHKDQFVLKMINEVLTKNNLSLKDITDIDVNPGPGSFTGIRVGISVAQALRFALNLGEKGVLPVYSV